MANGEGAPGNGTMVFSESHAFPRPTTPSRCKHVSSNGQAAPFVSIVVPTRNRARLLRDCIVSLMQQDLPGDRFEIIVVDDGSTDETPDVVREIRRRTNRPDIRYVRPEGRGLNVARNAGIQAAIGDPIAFVDDDVAVPSSWLKAVADGSLRHTDAGCFGGPVRLRLEGKPPRHCKRCGLSESEMDLGVEEGPVGYAIGANMALRRAAIEKIGSFNELLSG